MRRVGLTAAATSAVPAGHASARTDGHEMATDPETVDDGAGAETEFDYPWQFIGRRSATMPTNGMVATSHPIAA